jgi:hypothetical protein
LVLDKKIILNPLLNLKQKVFFIILFIVSLSFTITLLKDLLNKVSFTIDFRSLNFIISILVTIFILIILKLKIGFTTDSDKKLYKSVFLNDYSIIYLKFKSNQTDLKIKESIKTKENSFTSIHNTKDLVFVYRIYTFYIGNKELITLDSLENKEKLIKFIKSSTNLKLVSN